MNLRSIYVLAFLHVILYNCWHWFPEPWDKEILYQQDGVVINLYRNTVFDTCQAISVLLACLWPTFGRLSFIDVVVYVVHCTFLFMDILETAWSGDVGSPTVELSCYAFFMLLPGLLRVYNGDVDRADWRIWMRRLKRRRY